MWVFVCRIFIKHASPIRHITFWSLFLSICCMFTLFQMRQSSRKIKQGMFVLIFSNVCVIHFYFKNKWYIMKKEWMPFVKYTTCLSQSKELYFVRQFLRNFAKFNFVSFLWVQSELLQAERQIWRSKYCKLIILRTRLNCV